MPCWHVGQLGNRAHAVAAQIVTQQTHGMRPGGHAKKPLIEGGSLVAAEGWQRQEGGEIGGRLSRQGELSGGGGVIAICGPPRAAPCAHLAGFDRSSGAIVGIDVLPQLVQLPEALLACHTWGQAVAGAVHATLATAGAVLTVLLTALTVLLTALTSPPSQPPSCPVWSVRIRGLPST